ncbi:hypothetical protein FZEAL_1973 [Fusarium zealandicum]|uniref:Uncharacterized protein n=1 Tax=Fusarium zealandicum TaxID=1053134 RepID=A0A8H4XN81_9HYPO|nr:hypothetical protein FZEAL_1973 [Fusarium zealandicum]
MEPMPALRPLRTRRLLGIWTAQQSTTRSAQQSQQLPQSVFLFYQPHELSPGARDPRPAKTGFGNHSAWWLQVNCIAAVTSIGRDQPLPRNHCRLSIDENAVIIQRMPASKFPSLSFGSQSTWLWRPGQGETREHPPSGLFPPRANKRFISESPYPSKQARNLLLLSKPTLPVPEKLDWHSSRTSE